MIRALGAALVVMFATSSVEAQAAEGFDSDRPGYANSTSVVPALRPIFEMGAGFSFDEDDAETLSAPNLLIRFGLLRLLELRLTLPSVIGVFGPDSDVAFGDTTIGLKLAANVSDDFALSFVPSVSISSEGAPVTGRLEWNWSANLGAVSLGGNLAVGMANTVLGKVVQGEGSIALGGSITDNVGIFGQLFMIWPKGFDPMPYAGAGIAGQVTPRLQLDATVDVGLTNNATRLSVSAGLTVLVGPIVEAAPEERTEEPAEEAPPAH